MSVSGGASKCDLMRAALNFSTSLYPAPIFRRYHRAYVTPSLWLDTSNLLMTSKPTNKHRITTLLSDCHFNRCFLTLIFHLFSSHIFPPADFTPRHLFFFFLSLNISRCFFFFCFFDFAILIFLISSASGFSPLKSSWWNLISPFDWIV